MSIFRRQPKPAPQRRPSAYVRPLDATASAAPMPTQVRAIDWEEEAAAEERRAPVASRGFAYVPAASEIIMPRVQMANPNASLTADIAPAATIESRTLGGHQDRARAWLRYSLPLCATVALAFVVAAYVLCDMPLLSFVALLTYLLVFAAAYIVLLLNYWRNSPEGVALNHTNHLWGYYRREQAHRHQIEREAWQDQRAITIRREDRK